jgi:hypothetical protein
MNIEIDKYMEMTSEEFKTFVQGLHVKQVKQLYEYLRKQLIANAYKTDMDGEEVVEHVKKKELKVIVKRIYDAMGHVPNKKESKLIRQGKQEQKKTR